AVFDLSAANSPQTIGTLSGVAGSQVALGATSLTLGGGANSSFAGLISGTGGLGIGGSGTLALTGVNSYSGGTTLSGGGGLALGANGALGSGALTVSGLGGTLGATVPGITLANAINLNDVGLTLVGSNDLALGGAIGGTGGLTLGGTGTVTLNGANAYTGGTTLSGGGGLALGGNAALGSGALIVSGLGGTLTTVLPGLALANAIDLNDATLTLGGGNNIVLNGVIGGT
ncbi:autotransporter-associated beta strand repeat-containing protein, partial [Sphingomonas sp. 66-10]